MHPSTEFILSVTEVLRMTGLGAVTIPDYAWNRSAKMVFPSGSQRVYGYDALMRLKTLTVTDPGGNPLLDYAYTYDPTGNIVTKATEHGEYGYDYDASSRLITADNPVLEDEAYTYDNVGNRLTSAEVTGNWNYNANNELLGFGDVEYEYDANGNMTEVRVGGSVVWTYVYDAANRLVHVEDGTGSISADYYYDPFGRRLWKDVGGTKTYFFYSDEGLIGEYGASGNAIKTYGYKPDSTWTTDPLWLEQNNEYYFYQNDHLGTPQKLAAMNGAVVWSAQYSSFGEADVQVETIINNLRFPGQYYDVETGLHYNLFRYYDPKIGRYLRIDPIGFESGNVNLYGYVRNNPLKSIDFLGLTTAKEILNAFFSVSNTELLWIMGENDKYTRRVCDWLPVKNVVLEAKRDLEHNCDQWEREHKTDPSWIAGPTDPPITDPHAWDRWVNSPPGTDPTTCRNAFLLHFMPFGLGMTDALWTCPIGSFGIYVTVDKIDCCKKTATLNFWMYNSMDRESFGRFATHWFFYGCGMARQYMWWNWTEDFTW